MSVVETLEIKIEVDWALAKSQMEKFQDDIGGFRKRIEKEEAIQLSIDKSKVQQELRELGKELKDAIKSWDLAGEISVQAKINIKKTELAQANRELQNFARTGDKSMSVLGKLFDETNRSIERTRYEIIKLWGNAKELDRLEASANKLEQELKEWKIQAKEYALAIGKIQAEINSLDKSTSIIDRVWWAFNKALWVVWLVVSAFYAVKASIDEMVEWERAIKAIENALISTGWSAGITAEQIQTQAQALSDLTTIQNDVILSGQAVLLQFQNIKWDVFEDATLSALDMTAKLNGWVVEASALEANMRKLGKALEDPIKWFDDLVKQGVNFSAQQEAQIKSLAEAGKIAEAQKLILEWVQDAFWGTAISLSEGYEWSINRIKTWFADLLEYIGTILSPLITVFDYAFTTIKDLFSSTAQEWTQSIGMLESAFKVVSLAITGFIGTVSIAWIYVKWIIGKFPQIAKVATKGMMTAFALIPAGISAVFNSATGAVKNGVALMGNYVIEKMNWFVAKINGLLASIAEYTGVNITIPPITFAFEWGSASSGNPLAWLLASLDQSKDEMGDIFAGINAEASAQVAKTNATLSKIVSGSSNGFKSTGSYKWWSEYTDNSTGGGKSGGGGGGGKSSAVKNAEKEAKDLEAVAKKRKEIMKKVQWDKLESLDKSIKQNFDDVKKLADEYGNLGKAIVKSTEEGKKKVSELSAEILKARDEWSQSIAQRAVEVSKEITTTQDSLSGETDATKRLELQKKIDELTAELSLARGNTSQSDISRAEYEGSRSKTQELLDNLAVKTQELQAKKTQAEEETKIEIKKLTDKQVAIVSQIEREKTDAKALFDYKARMEKTYTQIFTEEIQARKTALDDLMARQRDANFGIKNIGNIPLSQVEKRSSVVSTVNKGAVTINNTISSQVDANQFLDSLTNRITN